MRQPSIHISKANLKLILKSSLEYNDRELNKLVEYIMLESKKYSLSHRQALVDTAKLYKSTNKTLLSNRDDAGYLSNLLVILRRKRKHIGINLIKVGSLQWSTIKEITALANSFCSDFNLSREIGYKLYLDIGLDRMTKFNLSRFNTLHQAICEDYNARVIIENDVTRVLTKQAELYYYKLLSEKTGLTPDYSKQPEKYVYFIKAKEEAIKRHIDIETYILSQFKGLEWCNSYPEPNQLIGEQAISRLNKYLSTNKINIKEEVNKVALNNVINKMEKVLKSW